MKLKKYISFFKIRFNLGLQYRAAAIAGISTQFFWGFLEILLFKAFYESDSRAFPMEFKQLASYIWLQQAFMAIFMLWTMDNEIFNIITNGNVSYEITRPINLYNMWFTKNIAIRLSSALMRCFPILIVASLLPDPYKISLPENITSLIFFIITAILGLMLVCAFCMLIYIVTFYTINSMGVRLIALSFTEILSGAIVPIPFFPNKIRFVLELLPFGSMQNLPLLIYSGNIQGTELISSVLLQIFWLVLIILIGKVWMKNALKKVVIQGG